MIKTRWLKIIDAEGATYLFNTHGIAKLRYVEGNGCSQITIAEDLKTSNVIHFTYDKRDELACNAYEDSLVNILALEKLG